MSAVGSGDDAGFHSASLWNNPEPEVALAVASSGAIVGATLANDVNLRDFEGRSALLLGKAKDQNASCAIGPFLRFFDATFSLDDVRSATISLTVEGEDGFRLEGGSSMAKISRDPSDLVAQTIGASHAYPDGFVLLLGTMFAPVADRGAPGMGFTHKTRRYRHHRHGKARPARESDATVRRVRTLDLRRGRAHAQSRPPGVDLSASAVEGRSKIRGHKHGRATTRTLSPANGWTARPSPATSTRRTPTTSSANTRKPTPLRQARRSTPRTRAFPCLVANDAAGAPRHPACAFRPRSWRGATSSGACSRARRARRCPRASARRPAPARSSTSSPARR